MLDTGQNRITKDHCTVSEGVKIMNAKNAYQKPKNHHLRFELFINAPFQIHPRSVEFFRKITIIIFVQDTNHNHIRHTLHFHGILAPQN